MFKRIYIAIDESDLSERVLDEGIGLMKSFNASARVTNVADFTQFNLGIDVIGIEGLQEGVVNMSKELLDKTCDRFKRHNITNYTTDSLSNVGGSVADTILQDAKEWGADMIVLGVHNLNFFTKLFTGSVIDGIVNNCSIPIMLIPSIKHEKA